MQRLVRTVLAITAAVGGITHAGAHDGGMGTSTPAGFTTLVTTTLGIEGLTGDRQGTALYVGGRGPGAGLPCPVWRVALTSVTPVVVGQVPAPGATASCNPTGIAFGPSGALYVADGDRVLSFKPDATTPPTATVFASGVPGANGLAFDRSGNLWVSDGGTALGRVWQVTTAGVVTEMFRIPTMANGAGVGRSALSLPPGTAQAIVANGLAFDSDGDLIVADTARGALWRVEFDRQGRLQSPLGCDTTYPANTLCWSEVWVAHPLLEGADGIALDRAGTVYAAANERNAVVRVSRSGRVGELYRSPVVAATGLRNGGALEFPTSPFLLGTLLCVTNLDAARRDNAPSTAGEIGGPGQPRGKISCLDQRLAPGGLPLPVASSSSHH